MYEVKAHSSQILCIDMDPIGRYFATGGVEAIVGIWEMIDCTCVRSISDKIEDGVTGVGMLCPCI